MDKKNVSIPYIDILYMAKRVKISQSGYHEEEDEKRTSLGIGRTTERHLNSNQKLIGEYLERSKNPDDLFILTEVFNQMIGSLSPLEDAKDMYMSFSYLKNFILKKQHTNSRDNGSDSRVNMSDITQSDFKSKFSQESQEEQMTPRQNKHQTPSHGRS